MLAGHAHRDAYAPAEPATPWKWMATEPGAKLDDLACLDGGAIEPVVTRGVNPGMSVGMSQTIQLI